MPIAATSAYVDSAGTGAPAEEIEVTPDMIKAGLEVLYASCAVEHPLGADEPVVADIYRAMHRVNLFLPKSCEAR